MNGFKSLFVSKTFWGAAVGILAAALAGAHYTLSAEDQRTIVDIVVALIGFGGNLFAIYGRVVASKKIGALLLGLAIGGAFVAGTPAQAQQQKGPARTAPAADAALPKPLLCDPLNLIPGCRNADGSINHGNSGASPFDNLTDDVLKKILADVTYAQALAKASGNKVTQPCWDAWVNLVTAQTQPVKDANGNVLALPDPHFFVAAERASEFINQIQPNSDLNIGCGAALNASKMAIGQLIGAVLAGGALGLFKLP
jgi:hypothetical protein